MYRPRKPSTHLKPKRQAVEEYAQEGLYGVEENRLYPLCDSVGHSPFLISWSPFHTTTPTSQHSPLSQLSFVFTLPFLPLTQSLPQFLLSAWGFYTRDPGRTLFAEPSACAMAPPRWRKPRVCTAPKQSLRMNEPGCFLPGRTRATHPTLVCPAHFRPGHLGAGRGAPLGPRNRR